MIGRLLMGAAFLSGAAAYVSIGKTAAPTPQHLVLLFEGELSLYEELKPCVVVDSATDGGFSMKRHLIAQGEGPFKGNELRGVVTFSQLAKRLADHSYCRSLIAGILEVEGGPEIFFEGEGFAMPQEPREEGKTLFTTSLRFEEPEGSYEWLGEVPGVWVGELDGRTRRLRFRVYVLSEGKKEAL